MSGMIVEMTVRPEPTDDVQRHEERPTSHIRITVDESKAWRIFLTIVGELVGQES